MLDCNHTSAQTSMQPPLLTEPGHLFSPHLCVWAEPRFTVAVVMVVAVSLILGAEHGTQECHSLDRKARKPEQKGGEPSF